MTLRESPAIWADDQRHMGEARRPQAQSEIEKQLPGSGGNQVVTADDFGHAPLGIIHDYSKLIRGRAGRFPHDEVTADLTEVDGGRAAEAIGELWRFGHAEAPGEGPIERRRIRHSA